MPRLRRSDCSDPGISRRGRGRGFEYLDAEGKRIEDEETLARIRELAIPPAWKDVWICLDANGHLQATGIDAAGRKQYLYHENWRRRRDQKKFDEMLEFAKALPRMRRAVAAHLRGDELSRERVLACAVRLLDLGLFRIGSESYAEQNESYGLATMKKEHVSLNGKSIEFDYPAKSGQRRVQSIVDSEVKEVVTGLKQRRGGGPELLAYRNSRRWNDLGAADINDYIKENAKGNFSAKDFRTWNATVLAAVALAEAEDADSKAKRERAIKDAVKGVAFFLGNTPAVARSSYIDPRVFDRFRSGWTIEASHTSSPRTIEKAVVDLLENS